MLEDWTPAPPLLSLSILILLTMLVVLARSHATALAATIAAVFGGLGTASTDALAFNHVRDGMESTCDYEDGDVGDHVEDMSIGRNVLEEHMDGQPGDSASFLTQCVEETQSVA